MLFPVFSWVGLPSEYVLSWLGGWTRGPKNFTLENVKRLGILQLPPRPIFEHKTHHVCYIVGPNTSTIDNMLCFYVSKRSLNFNHTFTRREKSRYSNSIFNSVLAVFLWESSWIYNISNMINQYFVLFWCKKRSSQTVVSKM